MNQKIRIKLRSYDYNLVDKSTERIVKTVRASGAVVTGADSAADGERIIHGSALAARE